MGETSPSATAVAGVRGFFAGYVRLFMGLGRLVLFAALAVALGTGVALPIWGFAHAFPRAFSVFVAVLLTGAVGYAAIGRLVARLRRLDRERGTRLLLIRSVRLLLWVALLPMLYGILYFAFRFAFVPMVALGVGWFAVLGLALYVGSRPERRTPRNPTPARSLPNGMP
jgi:hypothetical protein